MYDFLYTVKDGPRSVKRGYIRAQNQEHALEMLAEQGMFVVDIKKKKNTHHKAFSFRKLALLQKIDFYNRLLAYSRSGLDLVESLEIISEEGVSEKFAQTLRQMIHDIKNGSSFSDTAKKCPQLFNDLSVQLLFAGEQTGDFEKALASIVELSAKRDKLNKIISQAVIYPLFVLLSSFLLISLLLIFVLPRLTKMFTDMGSDLPLITRFLIDTSRMLKGFFGPFLLIFCLILFFWNSIEKRLYIKERFEKLLWKSKKISDFMLLLDAHRFSSVLSSMLASDVALQEALTMASSVVLSKTIKKDILAVRDSLLSGTLLSQAISQTRLKKFIAVRLIKVGEKTGKLAETFLNISQILEQHLNSIVFLLSKLLEPALIIFVGLVVGFIVLALVLPVLNMTNVFV